MLNCEIMPRKVFISFLGTSKYNECEYVKGDFSYRSCFVQEATFRYLTSHENWSGDDRILILLTQQAEERNWNDNGHKHKETGEIISSKGLDSVLKTIAGKTAIETIRNIPDGKDEQEIFFIFKKIFEYIQEGDVLYFDLTHGFRYLPMLILVLGNYAKFLKDVTVKSITYGNWEMSAGGTKPAPIIDLLSLSKLQDWTFAAGQFINNGNVSELARLNEVEYKAQLRSSGGEDIDARNLRDFVTSLKEVVEQRQTCRGLDIIRAKSWKKMIDAEKRLVVKNTLFSPIYERILEESIGFKENASSVNCFRSAEWCMQNGLYQQSLTLLQEFVVSHFCEMLSFPIDDKDIRGTITRALNYAYVKSEASKGYSSFDTGSYSDESRTIGELLLRKYPEFIAPFKQLSDIRNDINHAGMRTTPKPMQGNRIPVALKGLMATFSTLADEQSTPQVFINYSNHQSSLWSDSQLKEAQKYGTIIDVPFASVPPDADEKQICVFVDETISTIIKTHLPPSTIHIMGEMTLTYALVKELKALGYTCLASTTERKAMINEDGDKVTHFEFVKFRKY